MLSKIRTFFILGALALHLHLAASASLKQSSDSAWNEKLQLIRHLSKETGLPQHPYQDEELCFTPGCLDAALDILLAMNASIDPCKDFYTYSCGRWISNNPIPSDTYSYSHWYRLYSEAAETTAEILREPQDPNEAKPINQAKQFFNQCLDLENVNREGVESLKKVINDLGGWELLSPAQWNQTAFDWLYAVGDSQRMQLSTAILKTIIMPEAKDNTQIVIYLDQPDLVIPRDFLLDPITYEEIIKQYEHFIVDVATELNSTQTAQQLRQAAKSIIEFETKLANITTPEWNRYGNPERTYNPFSLKAYQEETDKIDESEEFTISWRKYLETQAASSDLVIGEEQPIIVKEMDYVKNLIPILKEEDEKILNNYIIWRIVANSVADTSENLRNISFQFQRQLTGSLELPSREHFCINKAQHFFGMAIGVKYMERYDEDAKAEVNEMLDKLQETFKQMVREAEWMQDETKVEAIGKVDEMVRYMIAPDWLDNKTAVEDFFKGVELGNGFLDSVISMGVSGKRTELSWLTEGIREVWIFHPMVVNAAYFAEFNALYFPGGVLFPPFLGSNRPKHQTYGAIGVIIGHEITHGFDNRGSLFDKVGNLKDWWDPVTKEEYQKKSLCMKEQYDGYVVERLNRTINGALTLGENIGDNGGLRESFRAYQKWVEENGAELRLPGLESLSPEQLFFIGYANIWCENITDEGLLQVLLTDPHSPSQWRVNGPMRNLEEFAKAYNCPEDRNGMNPPEEDQCTVW